MVRKIIEVTGADLAAPAPDGNGTLGDALIAATRLYQKSAKVALDTGAVSGIVHVTGGGLIENPPRVYSDDLTFVMDCDKSPLPALFGWLRDGGNIESLELARTFNCGIGMLIFCAADAADAVLAALQNGPEPDAAIVGALAPRGDGPAVILNNLDTWEK